MNTKLRAMLFSILALAVFGLALSGQTTTVPSPNLMRKVEAKVLMPSSIARIAITGEAATVDVRVSYMVISNPTASQDTFTIQDSDGATYAMFTDIVIAAKTTYIVPLPQDGQGLLLKGGIYLQSTSGNLVCRFQGRV